MVIGLTGGIGSGKTMVAKLFETMGCIIYNSDERAKELYFHKDIKQQVEALLGKEAYINDIELNKVFIAQVVFHFPDRGTQASFHPRVVPISRDPDSVPARQMPDCSAPDPVPFHSRAGGLTHPTRAGPAGGTPFHLPTRLRRRAPRRVLNHQSLCGRAVPKPSPPA